MGLACCKKKKKPPPVDPEHDDDDDEEYAQKGCRNRIRNFVRQLRKYFIEYAYITEIHGVRYLAEDRSMFEKIFWSIISLLSLVGCIIMFATLYQKFVTTPVIVSFSTQDTSIDQIPFPAVSICTETKTQNQLFSFIDVDDKLRAGEEITADERRKYEYLYLICDHGTSEEHNYNKTFTQDFYKTIDELKPNFDEFIFQCLFWGEQRNCSMMFRPIITSEGVCYSFNLLDKSQIFKDNVEFYKDYYKAETTTSDWHMEGGYKGVIKIETYPKRAKMSGADNSLLIRLMQLRENFDDRCKSSLQGFRVLLHNPMELPLMSKYYFRVSLDTSTVAAVQPKLMMTADQVKNLTPEKRNCYLEKEHPLQFYRRYSQSNCETECVANYTLKKCGCVSFHMPRLHNTPICGTGNYHCMVSAEDDLEEAVLETKLSTRKHIQSCDCMPSCTELSYNVEVSVSGWDWKNYFMSQKILEREPIPENADGMVMASLTIFLKSEYFLNLQRNELYGLTELIASCGGLLSLFMGISLLTLVEIVYFLSIRILCNKRLYGLWWGPDQDLA